MGSFWKRRSSRAEYWVSLLFLIAVLTAAHFFGNRSASGPTFIWLLLWAWRLHDFGKSGWYGVAVMGTMILIVIFAFAFGGSEFSTAFGDSIGKDDGRATFNGNLMVLVFYLALLSIQFGFTLWVGLKRGDAGENAYGPPTGFFKSAAKTQPGEAESENESGWDGVNDAPATKFSSSLYGSLA